LRKWFSKKMSWN